MSLQPVTIKLPPDCEEWRFWVPELQQLDGTTVVPNKHEDGDFRVPHPEGGLCWVKGAWCHPPAPQCQWLPWDAAKMDKGQVYHVVAKPFDVEACIEWNPALRGWVDTISGEEFEPAPDYYLANVPEIPE